jgi:hypothetical protein
VVRLVVGPRPGGEKTNFLHFLSKSGKRSAESCSHNAANLALFR